MRTRRIAAALGSFAACLAVPAAAVAKVKDAAPEIKAGLPLLPLVCTIVVLAGICAAAFTKPRRSQQGD